MLHSFETERLILRPTTTDDASFFVELYNTPKWLMYIGDRNVHTPEDAEVWIREKIVPQFDRLGFGNYVVIRKSDLAKIGACGLYDRPGVDGVDIGFAFLPQYEKQGYGFEAASKIKEAAFEIFGLRHISAITVPENVDSQRLIDKLGLKFQATIRLPDDDADLMLYHLQI